MSLQSHTSSDIQLHVVAYPVKIILLVSCPFAPNHGDATAAGAFETPRLCVMEALIDGTKERHYI